MWLSGTGVVSLHQIFVGATWIAGGKGTDFCCLFLLKGLPNRLIWWESWFLESWWKFKKIGWIFKLVVFKFINIYYVILCYIMYIYIYILLFFRWSSGFSRLWISFGDRISSSTTRFYPELLNAAPSGEGSDFEEPWSSRCHVEAFAFLASKFPFFFGWLDLRSLSIYVLCIT